MIGLDRERAVGKTSTKTESQFDEAMLDIYRRAKAEAGEIADRAYISSDAARLAAIHEDRRIAGFSYPDLLHWSPPMTPLNCVGVDDSAHLALAGLGQVEPSGKLFPHHDRGSGWQWLVLKFGQRVLARRREHPQPLVSSLLPERVKPIPS